MSARSLFVTGTDTGVGKTFVACAILRALARRGLAPGAMKPAESGVSGGAATDAARLAEAAGCGDAADLVGPLRYAAPLAPLAAARAEGRAVEMDRAREAFAELSRRHPFVLVEGAGGLLSPLAEGTTFADLAAEFGLPVLVVARRGLGTLNHTALTLEACAARALAVEGVVLNRVPDQRPDPSEATNADLLREVFRARVLAEIGPMKDADAAARELERQMPEAIDRWTR